MTEEIQKRIEVIKAGKVPDGYKKAVVGIVPSEWQEKRLSDLLRFQNGVNAEKEKFNSGIKMISVMDILDERPIVYDAIRGQVDIDEKALNNYSVTYGDILFQRSSETVEDAGKSNVYLDRDKTATYSGFVIRGKKIADYDPIYLNELLKTTGVRQQIIKYAAGSQHINVSQDSLARVRVCLASEEEQQLIAEVLSKWGQAIELQEKLIEKLELQKKALMQRLLTPTQDWKSFKVKDIFSITRGNVLAAEECDNSYQFPVYSSQTKENGLLGYYNKFLFENAITWTTDGANAGKVTYRDGKFYYTNVCGVLINESGYANPCFAYLLDRITPNYVSYIGNPKLMNNVMANITVTFPPLEEQKKISKVIVLVDGYIQKNIDMMKTLKQQQKSMQQLLLTGIVRV